MKAWVMKEYSGLDGLCYEDVPDPTPGPGQYLIQTEVAGLNFFDTLMIQGRYQVRPELPFVLGAEAAGTVIAVGEGVPLPVGARIAGFASTGAFAEKAVFDAGSVYEVPEGTDPASAMVLRGNYMTSHYALMDKGGLSAGETVLVLAAAGGVGSAAVEIAKAKGARVIAVARGTGKLESCRRLGADAVYDYTDSNWANEVKKDFGSDAIDIIYDPVGGEIALAALRLLGWNGRYLVIGFTSGDIPDFPANRFLIKNASAVGVLYGVAARRDPAIPAAIRKDILAMQAAGQLSPLIEPPVAVTELPAALARIAGRETTGKVVLAF
ncbi:NADPH:quinone oxidoreductase family protein [Nitratireductor alexandrii]|uniref:NADPH:quinone oxidoreductase family protein n=1 Tax=Nitratireductor alexandrii TaxID=2448161 RepID=UPI0013DFD169|nr:NADPH:quinone oxidoreductase family protein [Nitratireductor alexandrii]